MTLRSQLMAYRYKAEYNSLLWLNKNNKKAQKYKEDGLKILRQKAFNKLYLFISKNNLNKPISERFDSLFHEIGHWLHFQDLPTKKERKSIWATVDKNEIENNVSKRAIQNNEGLEFVAEVFKGLVKGQKFNNYIMETYKRLHGPKVKTT